MAYPNRTPQEQAEIDARKFRAWNELKSGAAGLVQGVRDASAPLVKSAADQALKLNAPALGFAGRAAGLGLAEAGQLATPNIDYRSPGATYTPPRTQQVLGDFNASVATTPGITKSSAFGGLRPPEPPAGPIVQPAATRTPAASASPIGGLIDPPPGAALAQQPAPRPVRVQLPNGQFRAFVDRASAEAAMPKIAADTLTVDKIAGLTPDQARDAVANPGKYNIQQYTTEGTRSTVTPEFMALLDKLFPQRPAAEVDRELASRSAGGFGLHVASAAGPQYRAVTTRTPGGTMMLHGGMVDSGADPYEALAPLSQPYERGAYFKGGVYQPGNPVGFVEVGGAPGLVDAQLLKAQAEIAAQNAGVRKTRAESRKADAVGRYYDALASGKVQRGGRKVGGLPGTPYSTLDGDTIRYNPNTGRDEMWDGEAKAWTPIRNLDRQSALPSLAEFTQRMLAAGKELPPDEMERRYTRWLARQ